MSLQSNPVGPILRWLEPHHCSEVDLGRFQETVLYNGERMRTHVLKLEMHDDVISTCDKMGWSKSRRVLLVWPSQPGVLERKLDLVILQRHARQLGLQLAIVSRIPEIGQQARALGIPVFRTAGEAQRRPWRRGRRRAFRPRLDLAELTQLRAQARQEVSFQPDRISRLLTFALGVLAVLALVLFFLPAARITLPLSRQQQMLDLPVFASPTLTTVSLSGGIPARQVEVIVEAQQTVPSSGQSVVGLTYATGTVTLTNLNGQSIAVPVGTIVTTISEPVIRFATTRAATLPAGPGQTVSVPIQALLPGTAGNLPGGAIAAVEGPLGLQMLAANPAALQGGTDRTARMPSAEDYDTLRAELLVSLEQTALTNFTELLGDGQQILPGSLALSEVQSENQLPPVGLPGDQLTLTLRVAYSAWAVRQTDVTLAAQLALDAALPAGYVPGPQPLQWSSLTQPGLGEDGLLHWDVRTQRQIQAVYSENEIITHVLARSPQQAVTWLNASQQLDGPAVVALWPPRWPWMPALPFRIQVDVP
jgi:hypothetical protein